MNLNLYCFFDEAIGRYDNLFFAQSDMMAVRQFKQAIDNLLKQSISQDTIESLSVKFLGSVDIETGKVESYRIRDVFNGKGYLKVSEPVSDKENE